MTTLNRTLFLGCLALLLSYNPAWAAKKAVATFRGKSKKANIKIKVPVAGTKKLMANKGPRIKSLQTQAQRLLAQAQRQHLRTQQTGKTKKNKARQQQAQKQYQRTLKKLNLVMKKFGKETGVTVSAKKICNPKCQARRFRRMQRKLTRLAKKNGWKL